jgi:uncharacterized membrane protein (DUF2068 family)
VRWRVPEGSVTDLLESGQRPAALRAIILYKLVRGGLSLVGSLALAGLVLHGGIDALPRLSSLLREHWTTGVAGQMAKLVLHALDGRRAWLAVIGLALDGVVTMIEGLALQRGYRWGPWLVVGMASVLVPFELVHLLHRPTIGRVLLLVANIAVALYLAQRALREHRHAKLPAI